MGSEGKTKLANNNSSGRHWSGHTKVVLVREEVIFIRQGLFLLLRPCSVEWPFSSAPLNRSKH